MMPNKDSLADASGAGRASVAPCQAFPPGPCSEHLSTRGSQMCHPQRVWGGRRLQSVGGLAAHRSPAGHGAHRCGRSVVRRGGSWPGLARDLVGPLGFCVAQGGGFLAAPCGRGEGTVVADTAVKLQVLGPFTGSRDGPAGGGHAGA